MAKSDATRRGAQLEHLAQVHALSRAIASAISAIEKNDLQQLETNLYLQEATCTLLAGSKAALHATTNSTARPNTVADDSSDRQSLQEIRQAYTGLAQVNRAYAALLKRVRKSAALIAALYRSQGAGYDRGSSALSQRQSWPGQVSIEV